MVNDDIDNTVGGSTLPDYQNFRNVLFYQWQEVNNATVNLRIAKNPKPYLKEFVRCYIRFYGQINDKSKLGNLTKEQRIYLKKYYDNVNLINISVAKKINEITRELMQEYGVFNLEDGDDDLGW